MGHPNDIKRNSRRWYLQSHLLDIPEIVVGYRDKHFTLRSTETFPTDHFAPDASWLQQAYNHASSTFHILRDLCGAYPFPSEGIDADHARDHAIWKATVDHGQVKEFTLLDERAKRVLMAQLETRAPVGERMGVLPARLVAQLRAAAA